MKLNLSLFILLFSLHNHAADAGLVSDIKTLFGSSHALKANIISFNSNSQPEAASNQSGLNFRAQDIVNSTSVASRTEAFLNHVDSTHLTFDAHTALDAVLVARALGILEDVSDKIIQASLNFHLTFRTRMKYEEAKEFLGKHPIEPHVANALMDRILKNPKTALETINQHSQEFARSLLQDNTYLQSTAKGDKGWRLTRHKLIELAAGLSIAGNKLDAGTEFQLLAATILNRAESAASNSSLLTEVKAIAAYYLFRSSMLPYSAETVLSRATERNPLPTKVRQEVLAAKESSWTTKVFIAEAEVYKAALLNDKIDNSTYRQKQGVKTIAERQQDISEAQQIRKIKGWFAGRDSKAGVHDIKKWIFKQTSYHPAAKDELLNYLRIRNDVLDLMAYSAHLAQHQDILQQIFDYNIGELFKLSPYRLRRLVDQHLTQGELTHAYFLIMAKAANISVSLASDAVSKSRFFDAFEDLLSKWIKIDLTTSRPNESIQKFISLSTVAQLKILNASSYQTLLAEDYSARILMDAFPRGTGLDSEYRSFKLMLIQKFEYQKYAAPNDKEFVIFKRPAPACSSLFRSAPSLLRLVN